MITADDAIAVATNRTANTISVFTLTLGAATPTAVRSTSIPVANAEPWAAVIGNDDNTAYVILRRTQEVVKITNLRTTPTIAMRVTVGSEPTGIAISPTGQRLYVANWSNGTVSQVNTADMTLTRTIDLNPALAVSTVLGTVTARPGLAHPRAISVTNNGNTNDDDETVYVTEFFSQQRNRDVPTDDSRFDVGRQGVVYRFNAGDGTVGPVIYIAPTTDTGFRDSVGATSATTGGVTGCFPNQLYATTLNNGRLYVTAVCESPRGPTGPVVTPADGTVTNVNNFKTEIHTAVYVIDTATNLEVPAQGLLLTREWQNLFDGGRAGIAMVPDDGANRRIPLIANDIAFAPMTNVGYVTSYGSNAVFRIQYNADGTVAEIGSRTPLARFINLEPNPGATPPVPGGTLPIGLSVSSSRSSILVLNESSRNLSVISIAGQAVASVAASADPVVPDSPEAHVNDGRKFFVTGRGRWSLRGQGWNSCEACHPDGLTDNVTWFFAAGPRQTVSTDGTYDSMGNVRLLNWTAILDEVHDFELNTRGNSGGVGAIVHRPHDGATPPAVGNGDRIIFDNPGFATNPPQVRTLTPQAGLNGSTRATMPSPIGVGVPGSAGIVRSALRDWEDIDQYFRVIRAPRGPNNLAAADVTAGRALFISNNCAGCHGGSNWTISRRFYNPSEANNNPMTGLLRQATSTYNRGSAALAALNPVSTMATATLFGASSAPGILQVNCGLRAVGTFPATVIGMRDGVAPTGVRVREVRADMTTGAQGDTGFNVPSLVGMINGAPYFHAGNARTLEELFDAGQSTLAAQLFAAHYRSFSSLFLQGSDRETQIRQIVAFMLSIDDSTMVVDIPTAIAGFGNPVLCPVLAP